MFLLSEIKRRLLPSGANPRRLWGGLCQGIMMDLDFHHHTQMFLGFFEAELTPWFKKLSPGIQSAADIGTANGYYSLYFMGKTKSEKILSFDPLEESQHDFTRNMELNGWKDSPRIQYSLKLVGDVNNQNTCTLDSLADSLPEPCFIKMDVEGAEGDILKAAEKILARKQTRWIIEAHSLDLEKSCVKTLESFGYQVKIVRSGWWRFFIPEKRFGHNCWLIAAKDIPIQ